MQTPSSKFQRRILYWGICLLLLLAGLPALAYFADATTWGYDLSAQVQQESTAKNDRFKPFPIIINLIAGLVLFLYGVSRLSIGLKKVAGEQMKNILARFTKNRFAGVLTGTVATTLLDSSSVTIIMVIALVNAGLLSFTQSLGVIMGSNIGTTISSQLIALELNKYAPIALAVGFALYFTSKKKKKLKHTGLIILGIGMVFYGLDVMGNAVAPLQDYKPFIGFMTRMEHPLLGALAGAVFTVIIQSSSATLGIIITLASQGLITLPAGIAIMLGAEIGTCADTLMATIGRSREAVRAGVFHLLFNFITVIIGVTFASQLAALVQSISGNASMSRQIANAHVLFNVAGVILFIGFTPLIARGLIQLIPDRKPKKKPAKAIQPGIA